MRIIQHITFSLIVGITFSHAALVLADTASDQYAVAASLYARQDWQAAVVEFEKFEQQFPTNAQVGVVHFFKGEAHIQLAQIESAKESYLKFTAVYPRHQYSEQAEFRLAECRYLLGEIDQAKLDFTKYLNKYPQGKLRTHAMPYIADIALKTKNYTLAIRLFKQLSESNPAEALLFDAQLGLARAYQGSREFEAAKNIYQQLLNTSDAEAKVEIAYELGLTEYHLGEYRSAVRELTKVVSQENPNQLSASYWIAKSHFQVRDWTKAIEIFDQLIDSEKLTENQDEIIYLSARAYYEQGELVVAKGLFEKQLSVFQDSSWSEQSLYFLVELNLTEQNINSAVLEAEKLWRKYPGSKLALTIRSQIGKHYLDAQKYELAIEYLTQANNDSSINSLEEQQRTYLLGMAHFSSGNWEESILILSMLSSSEIKTSQQAGANYVTGLARIQQQNHVAAIESFQQSLKIAPQGEESEHCKVNLAVSMALIKKFDLAQQYLNACNQQSLEQTTYLNAVHQIAELAYKAGNKDLAENLFKQMTETGNPENITAAGLTGLAWCQLEKNATTESNETIELLIEQNKNNPLIPTVLYGHAETLKKHNKFNLALNAYQKIINDYPGSQHIATALLNSAEILDNQNQNEEAERYYRRLLKEYPGKFNRSELLYRLAWVLIDLEKTIDAKDTLATIHEDHQQSDLWHDATYRLAEYAYKENNFTLANQYLELYFSKTGGGEESRHANYLLGRIAVTKEHWSQVVTAMDRTSENNKDDLLGQMALFWAAESTFRQKSYDNAQTRFSQLNNVVRGTSFEWRSTISLRLAQLAAHQNDWDLAFDLAEKVRLDYPEFDQIYEVDYLQARYMGKKAKFESAREAYKRVILSKTGSQTETAAMAQWMIGETYFHQKNYSKAIEAYSRVSALYNYPRWKAGALLQIGKCYEVTQQWDKANLYYSEVVKDHSQTVFSGEAQQRMSVVRQRQQQAQNITPIQR